MRITETDLRTHHGGSPRAEPPPPRAELPATAADALVDRCGALAEGVLRQHAASIDLAMFDCVHRQQAAGNRSSGSVGFGERSFGRRLAVRFRMLAAAEFRVLRGTRGGAHAVATAPLGLLSVDETEMQALKSSAAHRIGFKVEADLQLVNRNLARLIGVDEIAEQRSPFGPATLLDAVDCTLTDCGFEPETARTLIRVAGREIELPLAQIYQGINALFGAEPPLRAPRNRVTGPTLAVSAASPATTGAAISTALASLIAHLSSATPTVRPAAMATTGVPISTGTAQPTAVAAPLAPLHPDGAHPAATAASALAGSLEGLAALAANRAEDDFCAERRQFLAWRTGIRDLLTTLPQRVAFDLVTAAFDSIGSCDLVPVPVRQRHFITQTALLRIAVEQPTTYFASHRAVANAVERIALATVGTRADDDELPLIWAEALDLLAPFARDPSGQREALDLAITGLESVARQTGRSDATLRGVAARQAVDWMRRALPRAARDSFLREFLLWTWSRAIVHALLEPKLAEVLTPRYLRIARRVVWSVRRHQGEDDRARVRRAIPDLLRGLRAGMRAIRLGSAPELAFLTRLAAAHREALGLPPSAAQPAATGATTPASLPTPASPVALHAVRAGGRLTFDDLRVGHCFALRSAGGTRRVRLQSIAGDGHSYLFAGEHGERALMLSAESVAMVLRDGTLQRCG